MINRDEIILYIITVTKINDYTITNKGLLIDGLRPASPNKERRARVGRVKSYKLLTNQDMTKIGPFFDCLQQFLIFLLEILNN